MKSRLGPDGMTYEAKIDLNKGYIEVSEELYDESSGDSDGGNGDFSADELDKLKSRFGR